MENQGQSGEVEATKTSKKASKLQMVRSLAGVIRGLESHGWDKKELEAMEKVREKLRKEVIGEL